MIDHTYSGIKQLYFNFNFLYSVFFKCEYSDRCTYVEIKLRNDIYFEHTNITKVLPGTSKLCMLYFDCNYAK